MSEPAVETTTQELGPYTVDGEPFTMVLTVMRHADAETVHAFQVRDGSGRVHFEETRDTPVAVPHGFESMLSVRAVVLEGISGRALLVIRQQLPSAPLTGVTYQLFGTRGGQLQPLTAPLSWHGAPAVEDTAARLVRLDDGDIMTLQLWRFHFGVALPLRFELACEPGAVGCVQPAAAPAPDAPEFALMDVEADLREPQARNYITLLPAPGAATGPRVTVHADSQIQVLQAAARVSLRAGETLDVIVRDEHLRVRIDGREGWIRGPEDFETIGLQAAG